MESTAKLVTHASGIMIPPDRTILHILPQEFIVDAQEGIKNPVGMVGSTLDVYTEIITHALTPVKNLLLCLKKARINVLDKVLSHLASAEATLTPDERELGVLLIDIGGGTTDFAVYERGSLAFCGTLPVGGDNFTYDLSISIRTAIDKAEKIKRRYGCASSPELRDESIGVAGVGSN